MKSKKTLMALLVALLAFVAVVSVASGNKVEIRDIGWNNRWMSLICTGPADFRSTVTFWWTKDGKRVGDPVRCSCKGSKDCLKLATYVKGANDLEVRIKLWDPETLSICRGKQTFPAYKVPKAYEQHCYLPGGTEYVIFKLEV